MKYMIISLAFVLFLVPMLQSVSATSDDDDNDELEKCDITLKTGEKLVLDKPQDVELSSGEIIRGHNCEELQQDWANTTWTEYLEWFNDINKAGQELGQKFSDDRSTLDVLKDIEEKLEELNK